MNMQQPFLGDLNLHYLLPTYKIYHENNQSMFQSISVVVDIRDLRNQIIRSCFTYWTF